MGRGIQNWWHGKKRKLKRCISESCRQDLDKTWFVSDFQIEFRESRSCQGYQVKRIGSSRKLRFSSSPSSPRLTQIILTSQSKKVSYKKNLKDKNGSKKPLQQIRFVQQFGSVIDWQGVLALIYCAIAHLGDLCIYHWLFDHQSQIIPTERRVQQCTSLAPKDLSKPMFHFPKGLLQTAPWKFGFYSIVTKY